LSKVPKQSSDFRRSETGQKLEEILNANSSQKLETSQLRQALAEVALDQKLAVESLGFLNEIFSPSDPLPRRLNQNRILKALRFEAMECRYENVSSSTTNTFEWCLEDMEVPKSHPGLKISSREWLIRGTGVYHISERPGAINSTLMNFIVEHENTEECCLLSQANF